MSQDTCVCGHPLHSHERIGHLWVCLASREVDGPLCVCGACVDRRDDGEPAADYCACRVFRAVASGPVVQPAPAEAST